MSLLASHCINPRLCSNVMEYNQKEHQMFVKTKGIHLAPEVLKGFHGRGPDFASALARSLRTGLRNAVSKEGRGSNTFRVTASAVPDTGRVFVVITEKRRPFVYRWAWSPMRLVAGLLPGQFVISHKRIMMEVMSEAVYAAAVAVGLD